MMRYVNIQKQLLFIGIAMLCFGFGFLHTNAATEFMTNWEAKTYTPEWYTGKAFPTFQSFITVGFELIENGKIADLSKTGVRWYVDDVLYKNEINGLGIKNFTIYNQKYGGDTTSIKIVIPSYKGAVLEKTIAIPVKNPEVVIDAPFFEKRATRQAHDLFAWPFYFNAASKDLLNIEWRAEGGAAQAAKVGDAFKLSIDRDVEEGTRYKIEAFIKNQRKTTEEARASMIIETL